MDWGLQRQRDLHRTEDLRKLLNTNEIFDKFQPQIFKQLVDKILIEGTNKAREVAKQKIKEIKQAMKLDYFK